eukprot:9429833-Pyramimonas_sp.AAC.1
MSNMRTILILEQGREKIIPGSDRYKLLLGKGASVLDLRKRLLCIWRSRSTSAGPPLRAKGRCRLLLRPILNARIPHSSSKRQLAQGRPRGRPPWAMPMHK